MTELNKKPSLNDSRFFPNIIYEDDEIIISEFEEFNEIMEFPIREIWHFFNEDYKDHFYYIKSHMNGRFLIQFNKKEPLNSSTKFVFSIKTNVDGIEEEYFFDMNNIRIY